MADQKITKHSVSVSYFKKGVRSIEWEDYKVLEYTPMEAELMFKRTASKFKSDKTKLVIVVLRDENNEVKLSEKNF